MVVISYNVTSILPCSVLFLFVSIFMVVISYNATSILPCSVLFLFVSIFMVVISYNVTIETNKNNTLHGNIDVTL
jgi:hypothetical protein